MISAWELHQRLPASQLRIIADAGHAGLLLEPEQRDMRFPLICSFAIVHTLPMRALTHRPTGVRARTIPLLRGAN